MQIDLNIYPGTRISRAHPAIKPFAVVAREFFKPFRKYTKEKLSYKGGVILLDDYACAGHEKQYNAMNVLAKKLNFEILSTPTGQGIIIKS